MGNLVSQLAIVLICVFSASIALANDELNQQRAEESQRYTVKVGVKQGEILTSEVREKHGTGFVIFLREDEGIVFTNRHVVESPRRLARRIELGFFGGDQVREKIPGECIFESPLHDLAVIRFDPRELKRLRGHVKAADLASAENFPNLTRMGASVMASGNPFSSEDVRTFGAVSGWYSLDGEGLMLQIDAAINPGNSGGPLIHLKSGQVIGLTTAGIVEADGIGWVLPITDAVEEYELFLKSQQYAMRRRLMIAVNDMPMSTLRDGFHIDRVIPEASVEPGFYTGSDSLLVVTSVSPGSKLQKGDLLISVNGQVIGDRRFRISHAVQRGSGDTARVRVIRDYTREVTVDEPIHVHAFAVEATTWDIISFGGFVFEEVNEEVGFFKTAGRTRVIISKVLPGTYAENHFGRYEGSFLSAITVGGKRYEIRELSDLRAALANPPADVKAAVLSIQPPLFIFNPTTRRNVAVPDNMFDGMPALSPQTVEIGVPLERVYDNHAEFHAARAGFDFSGFNGAQAGLTSFVGRPVGCAAAVSRPQ